MAEGVEAAGPHDEVQAGGEQREDQHVGEQHQRVAARRQGQQREGGEQDRAADENFPRRQFDGRLHQSRRPGDRLCSSEQAPGPGDQHHSHDEELHHQRRLGPAERDAERLGLGDQQRGEEGAGNRAQPADHDDHESIRDHGEIDIQAGRLARDLQRTAEARQQRAEREHAREQPSLVDAEHARHLAVFRGGAHKYSDAGFLEDELDGDQDQRPDRDQQQVVGREGAAGDGNRTFQAGRARPEQVFRAPGPQRRVLDDEYQRERGQQLQQLRRLVDSPEDQEFDCESGSRNRQRGRRKRQPEADAAG